jgi:hypothetical protein
MPQLSNIGQVPVVVGGNERNKNTSLSGDRISHVHIPWVHQHPRTNRLKQFSSLTGDIHPTLFITDVACRTVLVS